MALYCLAPGDFLTRTSGLVAASSDYTLLGWVSFTTAVPDLAVFGHKDNTYTNFAGLYTDLALPRFDLSVEASPAENDIFSNNLSPNVWYPVAYVRAGSVHTLYLNYGAVNQFTLTITADTWTTQFLGNDGLTPQTGMLFSRVREWSQALTPAQMQAEFGSPVAVLQTNLASDWPLSVNVSDISGNNHTWTVNGAPTFVPDPTFGNATPISTLISQVRTILNEPVAAYWADTELLAYMQNGAKDLWRKILGIYQEHFVTVDETNVTLNGNAPSLTGVPADLYRVVAIEPRVLGQFNPNQGLIFKNRKYNSPDFIQARAADPVTPQSTVIFYDVMNAGAPVGPPTILVAPLITAPVLLRLTYNQTLPALSLTGTNPVPGETDQALIAWTVAWAKSKEGTDPSTRVPDANWLGIYGTEKANVIAEMSVPRSEQDQEVVEAMFQDMWPDWQ